MNNHAENKSMWTNPESSSQMPCHNAPINKSAYFSYTDNRVMHIDQYIKQKLENLLDQSGQEWRLGQALTSIFSLTWP